MLAMTARPNETWMTAVRAAIMLAALVAMSAPPAFAAYGAGVFQLDGNTVQSTSTQIDDWDNIYKSVTGLGTARQSHALVQVFARDGAEPDRTTFGMSNKDFQRANQ